jgi:CO/xanthine dehydrogenase Mo-binding subunit
MSEIFFRELGIQNPDYHLGVGSDTHGIQTGLILQKVEEVLTRERADVTVVYGDTNSTLGSTLAAVKMHISVAHVEAGLRSFNKNMPEEINRVLTDHASTVLFCPTEAAVGNLRTEGFARVVNDGTFMRDTWQLDGYEPGPSNPLVVNVGDVVLDDTPVQVVAFSPPDGAQQIPINTPIQVTFSDPLSTPSGITSHVIRSGSSWTQAALST